MAYGKRPLWQWILLYAVIGGVIYTAVYYFYFAPSLSIPAPVSQNTVLYTPTGFSPKTLTITPGKSVTFKNESGQPLWVASDPHPVHTDHSAFDQKTAGDTYTFTFTELGTSNYHNHLSPSHTGTVVVE